MWRSGTSWLEDLLGKGVDGSGLFGHEQQIFPLLSMCRTAFGKTKSHVRQIANKPVCDITDNFHEEFGLKFHKVLNNSFRHSGEEFNSFCYRLCEFFLEAYSHHDQVVEKSPENGSPYVFNTVVDVFQNKETYKLIYLARDYREYLSSCNVKFVKKKGMHSIDYYSKKWLDWNTNAINTIQKTEVNNLYVIYYENLVKNHHLLNNITSIYKKAPKIRNNTLDKWQQDSDVDYINELYEKNKEQIDYILDEVKSRSLK